MALAAAAGTSIAATAAPPQPHFYHPSNNVTIGMTVATILSLLGCAFVVLS